MSSPDLQVTMCTLHTFSKRNQDLFQFVWNCTKTHDPSNQRSFKKLQNEAQWYRFGIPATQKSEAGGCRVQVLSVLQKFKASPNNLVGF